MQYSLHFEHLLFSFTMATVFTLFFVFLQKQLFAITVFIGNHNESWYVSEFIRLNY